MLNVNVPDKAIIHCGCGLSDRNAAEVRVLFIVTGASRSRLGEGCVCRFSDLEAGDLIVSMRGRVLRRCGFQPFV